jgi:predicted TIM-barrel fold metal-dependent hydrolase
MKLMAALPQVCVKLSMLGYAVPGWHADAAKEALLKSLVLETIELFGHARCMFASNFIISAAGSDSDGKSDTGPEMPELYSKFESWVVDRSEEDKVLLFAGAAEAFYKI